MKSFMGAVLLIAGAAGDGAMQDKHSSTRFEQRQKDFDAAAIVEREARGSIVMLASAPSDMDFASMKRELEAAEKKEEIARKNMKRAETQMKAEEASEKREAARMRESEVHMKDLDRDNGKPSKINYAPPRRRRAYAVPAYVQLANHKSCGPNTWLGKYSKDPAVCMRMIKTHRECSQEYFNHATNGDGNCGCVKKQNNCATARWNEVAVRIYRIEGNSAETLSLASTGMEMTEVPSMGVAAIGACAGVLFSVVTYVVLRRRPQQSDDYLLAN